MRVPLIAFGLVGMMVGALLTLLSIFQGHSAANELERVQQSNAEIGLWTQTERRFGDPDALEEADDRRANEERIQARVESWKSYRRIGLVVLVLGGIVASVGLVTPKAQLVEVSHARSGPPHASSSVGPTTTDAPLLDPTSWNTDLNGDVESRLRTLQSLRDQGILSQDEYARRRTEIIDSI